MNFYPPAVLAQSERCKQVYDVGPTYHYGLCRGGYTAALRIGSQRQPVNLLLDTGSAALAVRHSVYQPYEDTVVELSADVQIMCYGAVGQKLDAGFAARAVATL